MAAKDLKDSFFYAVILGLFKKFAVKFVGELIDDKMKQVATAKELLQIKDELRQNFCINTFSEQCYKINEIFMKK